MSFCHSTIKVIPSAATCVQPNPSLVKIAKLEAFYWKRPVCGHINILMKKKLHWTYFKHNYKDYNDWPRLAHRQHALGTIFLFWGNGVRTEHCIKSMSDSSQKSFKFYLTYHDRYSTFVYHVTEWPITLKKEVRALNQ